MKVAAASLCDYRPMPDMRCIVVLLTTVLLSACGGGGDGSAGAAPVASLRLVNAIPDSPALEFGIDNRLAVLLSFERASTYLRISAGDPVSISVDYERAGRTIGVASTVVTTRENREYTVIALGKLDSPRLIVIDNAPMATDATDQAEIQFAHAATAIDAADLFIDEQVPAVDPDATLSSAEVGDITKIHTGAMVEFRVRRQGQGADLWSSGPFTFAAPVRRLLLLIDYFGPGGAGVRMVRIGEAGTSHFPQEDLPAAIRVANMIADRGPVDVIIDRTPFVQDVRFGDVTDYIQTPPHELAVRVTPFAQPNVVLAESTFPETSVLPGSYLTLTVAGLAQDLGIALSNDDRRRTTVKARLSLTHGSPGALARQSADVYLLAPGESVADHTPDIGSLAYTGSTDLLIDEGVRNLILTAAGSADILAGPFRVDLTDNGIFRIFIADSPGGESPADIIRADDFSD